MSLNSEVHVLNMRLMLYEPIVWNLLLNLRQSFLPLYFSSPLRVQKPDQVTNSSELHFQLWFFFSTVQTVKANKHNYCP